MTYYIQDENKNIVLADIDKEKLLKTIEFMPQYASCEIQETDKGIIQINGEFVFSDDNKALQQVRQTKLQEVYNANTAKYSDKDQTITINLPVTLTDGKTETQVTSFKLLTMTSRGMLKDTLKDCVEAPSFLQGDYLVTADGLQIKGLYLTITYMQLTERVVDFIKYLELQVGLQIRPIS